jgi:DNA-binding XRE family transcriptional regulator
MNLKEMRKARGMTQAQLAEAIGVTATTIVRWEKGVVKPRPNHRMALEVLFADSKPKKIPKVATPKAKKDNEFVVILLLSAAVLAAAISVIYFK